MCYNEKWNALHFQPNYYYILYILSYLIVFLAICLFLYGKVICHNRNKPVNPEVYPNSFILDWIFFIKMSESPYFTSILYRLLLHQNVPHVFTTCDTYVLHVWCLYVHVQQYYIIIIIYYNCHTCHMTMCRTPVIYVIQQKHCSIY